MVLFIKISEMKLNQFYYLKNSDDCYNFIHNVSVDTSFGLLQMFQVELWSSYRTLFNPRDKIGLVSSFNGISTLLGY